MYNHNRLQFLDKEHSNTIENKKRKKKRFHEYWWRTQQRMTDFMIQRYPKLVCQSRSGRSICCARFSGALQQRNGLGPSAHGIHRSTKVKGLSRLNSATVPGLVAFRIKNLWENHRKSKHIAISPKSSPNIRRVEDFKHLVHLVLQPSWPTSFFWITKM